MTTSKRILFFGLFIISQAIYLPLNKYLQGGIALKTSLDEMIPIQPIWSIPYLLWMFSWFWLSLWAALKMPADLFKAFSTASLIVILSAMAVFVVYPTYVDRPLLQGSGIGMDLLHWIYSHDGKYNAFPSGHIYLVTLTAIFYSRWHPRSTWLWAAIVLIVSASTLLTGQHYIIDIVGGLFFAIAGATLGGIIIKPTHTVKVPNNQLLSKNPE